MYLVVGYLLSLFYFTSASKLCYAPDGSLSPGDGYVPCVNTINVHSMCCVLNVTALELIGRTAADADSCSSNGLCLISTGEFARDFCTDQTWQSPNCLKKCTNESSVTGGVSDSFSLMTHCADGSWCCGRGNDSSCCNKFLGFQLAAAIPPYVTSTSSAVDSTSTEAMTPGTNEANSHSTSSDNGTNNAKIWLGVALGVEALVIVGLAIKIRSLQARRPRGPSNMKWAAPDMHERLLEFTRHEEMRNELEPVNDIHEVAARREPIEMD